jgi:hypothetical protein
MRGDDLMVHDKFIGSDRTERTVGKVSVSITYSKEGIAIGHTGINVKAGSKAPGFAYSSNLSDEQIESFMKEVNSFFRESVSDMQLATTKVIV